MKTTTFLKTAVTFVIILLITSCQSTSSKSNLSDNYDDELEEKIGENSMTHDEEFFENTTTPATLTPQEKANSIAVYNGWFQFAHALAKMNMNNSQSRIQQQQEIINSNRQIAQSVGMAVDTQLENQFIQGMQREQTTYQINNYILNIAQEQGKILQSIHNDPNLLNNDQLFAQVTSFNAVLLYMIFGKGYGKTFQEVLQPATYWYFSPQCDSDIKNGIAQMSAHNQMMAKINRGNTTSGSSIFSDDRHRQRFSDAMLNQKSWINPENGDVYKLPISIENPRINGNDMQAY